MLLTVGFTSCEKKSKDLTSITYYAELFLEGDEVMGLNLNGTYTEPGYTAIMNGEDVTSQVQVFSDIDPTTKGVYTVNYVIVNPDGFAASASRTVIVYDTTDPVEGFWWVDPNSYRIYDGGSPVKYGGNYYIIATNNGDGTYTFDDLMGGWYAQRAGYGELYAMEAEVTVAGDGTITLNDSYVPGWQDAADALTAATFDAATGTINYHLQYATVIDFYVTLNKGK